MLNNLYVNISAQIALRNRMETLAHNVANMNTPGFRSDSIRFEEQVSKLGDRNVSFSSSGENFISRASGPVTKTDNPLDISIQGESWFAIQTPAGQAYTRDGRMKMTPEGALQTLNGYPVLDAGGSGITVDPSAGKIDISRDGMINQNGRQIGAFGLYTIDPLDTLSRYDNSAVIPKGPATPTLDFTTNSILQGYVEGSNVNPVLEMSKLIQITRTYEDVSAAIDKSESSQQDAIRTLGGS